MSGGGWKTQNKVRPGAYINVDSVPQPAANETTKGVVFTMTQGLKWGENGIVTVTAVSNFEALFGLQLNAPELTALRLILLKAKKVLVYNFNDGVKATGTAAPLPWTFEAKYSGTRGNDIKVNVLPDASGVAKYTVQTFFGTDLVDSQAIVGADKLIANDYVVPTVIEAAKADNGVAMLTALASPVIVTLSGGTDEDTSAQVDGLIEAIETHEFNVATAAGQPVSAAIHQLLATTVIRLREEEGVKAQAVIPEQTNYTPDHEGVIVLGNGVKLQDGTVLDNSMAAAFVAGAESVAGANKSLTFFEFPDAMDVVPRYNGEAQETALKTGVMIFIAMRDMVKIQVDINSLTTFTDKKNHNFSKNRVLRVLDDIANDTRITWEDNFIGQVTNNATGRDQFKANRAQYLAGLQAIGAIENFDPSADIVVIQGDSKDSIVATVNVQPTDSLEKLYMTVSVD
jgi:hypothetical protein